jgi:hypothetical protein
MCASYYSKPDIKEELEGWNLQFDPNLLKFQARVLPPEKIYQRSATVSTPFAPSSHPFACRAPLRKKL